MTFGSTFGRTFSPTFQPKSQAAVAGDTWWDLNGTITSCVAAYQPKGAASFAASRTNLANSGTYTASDGDAPAWDSTNGWKFTNNKYLNSGYSPGGTPTMIFAFTNGASDAGSAAGAGYYAGGKLFYILPYYPAEGYFGFVSEATAGGTMTSGIIANAAGKLYKDGTYIKTITGTLSGAGEIHIGKLNGFERSGQIYIQAFALYDTQLSSTDIANLTTAMAAL